MAKMTRKQFVAEFTEKRPAAICKCGHTGDGAMSQHLQRGISLGHGACTAIVNGGTCTCRQFTFKSWVPEFEEGLKKYGG